MLPTSSTLEYSVPMKKHWVNPNCQNSEPKKRTVSVSAHIWTQGTEPFAVKLFKVQYIPSCKFLFFKNFAVWNNVKFENLSASLQDYCTTHYKVNGISHANIGISLPLPNRVLHLFCLLIKLLIKNDPWEKLTCISAMRVRRGPSVFGCQVIPLFLCYYFF